MTVLAPIQKIFKIRIVQQQKNQRAQPIGRKGGCHASSAIIGLRPHQSLACYDHNEFYKKDTAKSQVTRRLAAFSSVLGKQAVL